MKKIFLSLIIFVMTCTVASAHIVYTTEAGDLGLITIGNGNTITVSSNEYSGGTGSVVASYWENNTSNGEGNSKIILITPKDNSVSGDTAVRFSSYEDLSSPIDDEPIYLANTYGTPIICGTNSGGSLYLATDTSMREYKTASFNLYNTYTYTNENSAMTPEIKSVIKSSTRVYLLIAFNDDKTATNSNDIIVMLEGTLNPKSEYSSTYDIETLKNAYTMNFIKDSKIAVGCSDGVYNVAEGSATSIVSSDCPVVAIYPDTSSGFYYITQSEDKKYLYHYTTIDTTPSPLISESGNGAKLAKDSTYNVMGVMIGEKIVLIKMDDDTILQTYSSTDLGGNPISIASSSTTGNSADSSGGCNSIRDEKLGFRNVLLLLLALFGLFFMKTKL